MQKINSFFKKNFKYIAFLFVVGFLVSAPSFSFAQGGCGLDIGCYFNNLLTSLTNFFLAGGVLIVSLITAVFALLAEQVYKIVVFLTFNLFIANSISISVLPGAPETNEVVTRMWNFMKDFANMFYLIILVAMGFATILRIAEYEIKKLIIPFIVSAVLINFSGVVVAFFVDVAAILNNFFIKAVGDSYTVYTLSNNVNFDPLMDMFSKVFDNLGSSKEIDVWQAGTSLLMFYLVQLMYYSIGTIVFAILAILFKIREVALYLITIFGPMAFLAYIFPGTRSWFQRWWGALISWAFLGVPVLFSLYLAASFMEITKDTMTIQLKSALEASGEVKDNIGGFNLFNVNTWGDFLGFATTAAMSFVIIFMGIWVASRFGPTQAHQALGRAERGARWLEGKIKEGASKSSLGTKIRGGLKQRITEPMGKRMMEQGAKFRHPVTAMTVGRILTGAGRKLTSKDEQLEIYNKTHVKEGASQEELQNQYFRAINPSEKLKILMEAYRRGKQKEIVEKLNTGEVVKLMEAASSIEKMDDLENVLGLTISKFEEATEEDMEKTIKILEKHQKELHISKEELENLKNSIAGIDRSDSITSVLSLIKENKDKLGLTDNDIESLIEGDLATYRKVKEKVIKSITENKEKLELDDVKIKEIVDELNKAEGVELLSERDKAAKFYSQLVTITGRSFGPKFNRKALNEVIDKSLRVSEEEEKIRYRNIAKDIMKSMTSYAIISILKDEEVSSEIKREMIDILAKSYMEKKDKELVELVEEIRGSKYTTEASVLERTLEELGKSKKRTTREGGQTKIDDYL
ncbi:hypothetical protein HRbin34_00452 [bacterium HR34]|nr:hypothetical protein HRbin34_00452 [bacterium HR34]